VPPHIAPADAVALITLKETLSCLNRSDVQAGQSLAIVGTGPVAQSLVFVAKLSGLAPVVVFGRRPRWASTFARLGADGYATEQETPPEAQAILDRGGFDRAIEAVGSRAALARCLEVVRPDGKVNIYGVAPESEAHLPEQEADPRVFRSRVVEAEAHDRILEWVQEGHLVLADWISHCLPWLEYRQAFERVHDKEATKVALTFGE
jgi:L-iditol 2-dehydrogenase